MGTIAAAQLEEVKKLADVHGHDYLGLACVGQQITSVLGGDASLDEVGIRLERGTGSLVVLGLGTGIDDGLRYDELRLLLEGDIALRLLVVRCLLYTSDAADDTPV